MSSMSALIHPRLEWNSSPMLIFVICITWAGRSAVKPAHILTSQNCRMLHLDWGLLEQSSGWRRLLGPRGATSHTPTDGTTTEPVRHAPGLDTIWRSQWTMHP